MSPTEGGDFGARIFQARNLSSRRDFDEHEALASCSLNPKIGRDFGARTFGSLARSQNRKAFDGRDFDSGGLTAALAQSQKYKRPSSKGLLYFWLPGPMAERTLLWDMFDYVFDADRRRIRPIRTYRNPIFVAGEWADAMQGGDFPSRRAFAKAVGVSHARVSQVLGLLRLDPRVLKNIKELGDPLSSRIVTERKLRTIVNLPGSKQMTKLNRMLPYANKLYTTL